MNIVVTGGAGFIGGHLCRALRERGHDVYSVDRAAEYGSADLLYPGTLVRILDAKQPDAVFHLAAQVGRLFGEADLRHTVKSNAELTTLVAKACADRGVRLMYTSSSEVYGDQGETLCWEAGPCLLPHNLYGLTKRWGEEACRLYMPREMLTIMRLSMPYGPGAPPGKGRRALDTMLWQAVHRLPITAHLDAERSWCWVGDTVEAMLLLLERGEQGVWNVGRDDVPVSMVDLARRCCVLAGADPDALVETVRAPENQTVVKRLATHKLRGLGWRPMVELDEGLSRMLEWVRHFDSEGRWVKEPVAA